MGQISFWKGLGLVGELVSEFNKAYEDDQKIDALEVVEIGTNLVERMEIAQDDDNKKYLEIAKEVIIWLRNASADGKITISEVVNLSESFADRLGYDFDTTGFTIK